MSDKVVQKITDFETKKSVHINLTKQTHSSFRKALFDYGLSMQEVFELFAFLAGAGDDTATDIVRRAKNKKLTKTLERLKSDEVDDLYDAISQVDPFGK